MASDFPFNPTRRSRELDQSAIAQAAAEWVVRCDRGLSLEERIAFSAWAGADPRHATELERLGVAWSALDCMNKVEELQAMADEVIARARAGRARRRFVRFASLACATAAAAAAILFNLRSASSSGADVPPVSYAGDNYRVLESTVRRLTLPDGSVAELNGASEIEVDFSATERRVQLTAGEAHFIVARDATRPFYVAAGPVTVRAVGTAFNVRLAAESIEILVTEGTVQLLTAEAPSASMTIEAPRMAEGGPAVGVGQRAVISLSGTPIADAVAIGEVGLAEIDRELGWQSVRLVFNNTPLHEVIAGFNEYNVHRLTIGDSRIRGRTLTGVFRADNLDGFVRLLRASLDVKAEPRTSHETVLMPAR